MNGWYFYSLNWIAPGNMLRSLPSILWHVARSPRTVAGVLLVALAVVLPLGLIAAVVAWLVSRIRRRRREQALDG